MLRNRRAKILVTVGPASSHPDVLKQLFEAGVGTFHGARLACSIKADWIVAYSLFGATARRVSARRPGLPILVLTPASKVARQAALIWGAYALPEKDVSDYCAMVSTARGALTRLSEDRASIMVVLAGIPFGRSGSTNNIRVLTAD